MEIFNFVIGYFAIAVALKMILWRKVLLGNHKPKIRIAKSLILAILFGPLLIIYAHGVVPTTALMALIASVSFDNGYLTSSTDTLLIFVGSVLVSSIAMYGYYAATLQKIEDLSGVTKLVKKAHK